MTPPGPRRARLPRGFAVLEFVLSLPLVLVLLGAIIMGAYVLMTRLSVSHSARRVAWLERHGTPAPDTLPLQTFDDMGFLPGYSASQGLIDVAEERRLDGPPAVRDRHFRAAMNHDVMGSSWDFQTIPFVPRDPLQPDPRLGVYPPGVPAAVLSAFAGSLDRLGN